MGTSKYPRPGQRISPATLREILDVPVPLEIGDLATGHFEKLADLDETVWDHASASTCKDLAKLVLDQVQRSLSELRGELSGKRLPRLDQPLNLSALEIEVRTFNCLKLHFRGDLRPLNESLNALCIRDLLKLAGFGVHSLVDLLVALECVKVRPDQFEQLELKGVSAACIDPVPASQLPSEFLIEISRFPRKGHRIAPHALEALLDAPARDRRMGCVKLRELDESVWERFESKTCHKLASEVVIRIKRFRSVLSDQFGDTTLPMPRTKGKVAVIQLEGRTFNCLNDAALLNNPTRLAEATFNDLLALTGFGVKCLVDLLCAFGFPAHKLQTAHPSA